MAGCKSTKQRTPKEDFLMRLQLVANSADMKNCLLAAKILLKYTEGLIKTQVNRNINKSVFEELRKTPNMESINR